MSGGIESLWLPGLESGLWHFFAHPQFKTCPPAIVKVTGHRLGKPRLGAGEIAITDFPKPSRAREGIKAQRVDIWGHIENA